VPHGEDYMNRKDIIFMHSVKYLFLLIVAFFMFGGGGLYGGEKVTLVITGNMGGRFSTEIEGQEKNDPLIRLGQSIAWEKKKKNCLFFDLGNAFYPGIVSKYSYGSAVVDFFKSFQCDATVISTNDLQIGLGNFKFLRKGKSTRFLSSNLYVDGKNYFHPYFLYDTSRGKIAFIGVSSPELQVDATEQALRKVTIKAYSEAVQKAIGMAEKEGAKYFILLSGLTFHKNLNLLKTFPQLAFVITGGDNKGRLFGHETSRILLKDGRSVSVLPEFDGYLKVDVDIGQKLVVNEIRLVPSKNYSITDYRYRDFIKRISGWKRLLRKELDVTQYDTGKKKIAFTGQKCADLIRREYSAEIALLDKKAVKATELKGAVSKLKLHTLINTEFPIVTFRLKGSEVKLVAAGGDKYISRGYKDGKVQGYPVEDNREYQIAATQSVLKVLQKILHRKIKYKNTFKNLFRTVSNDLKNEKFIVNGDEKQIENSFRFLSEFYVSFVFENSMVDSGDNIETPIGRPLETYTRYGIESTLNFIFYNRLHYFKVTPHIYYVRQGDTYLSNLLRGTFYYKLNLPYFVNPYHKSQIDTVVSSIDGSRPTIIRETIGATILAKYLSGTAGFGIEKEIIDPEGSLVYGLEALLAFNITFAKYLTYGLGVDAFFSFGDDSQNKRYLRSDIKNSLTFTLSSSVSISVSHVLFYYYSMNVKEHYLNSQIITAANYKTDFKIW